eukprot:11571680-Alexandrium_andersonii.AAC.1
MAVLDDDTGKEHFQTRLPYVALACDTLCDRAHCARAHMHGAQSCSTRECTAARARVEHRANTR